MSITAELRKFTNELIAQHKRIDGFVRCSDCKYGKKCGTGRRDCHYVVCMRHIEKRIQLSHHEIIIYKKVGNQYKGWRKCDEFEEAERDKENNSGKDAAETQETQAKDV